MSDLQPLRHIFDSAIRVASSKARIRPKTPDRGDFIEPQTAIGSLAVAEIEDETEGLHRGACRQGRVVARFFARNGAHLMLFSPQGELS